MRKLLFGLASLAALSACAAGKEYPAQSHALLNPAVPDFEFTTDVEFRQYYGTHAPMELILRSYAIAHLRRDRPADLAKCPSREFEIRIPKMEPTRDGGYRVTFAGYCVK